MPNAYEQAYQKSLENPESFWGEIAQESYWFKKWDAVLSNGQPHFYRWFAGGMVNTCYNALDFHIDRGRGRKVALIYDSPVTGTIVKYTYSQLRDLVARFAGVLVTQGVKKGDRVVIYMPMIPEAAIAMLACARIGAIHSVVFGGFAAKELATRIDDARPKVIVSASCGIEGSRIIAYKPLLDKAIELAGHKPCRCIIYQRPMEKATLTSGRDLDWKTAMKDADPIGCVPVAATDPLYILYTSGTTGQPKGVVRDNGGHIVALKWSMKAIYDIDEDDVWWAASDVGWVVGHSYIVYAPLLKGCTTILFEGKPVGTPDAGVFWRVISEHKVSAMFTAPTAYRAIKREDPDGKLLNRYDLSSLRILFLAGERSDPDTIQWSERHLKVPVIDHWWQTETGWAIAANCMGLNPYPVKYGSPTKPVPGWNLQVLGEDGQPVAPGQIGNLVVKLPLPPGALPTLWQNDERFVEAYMSAYPGYYKTSDAGYIDEDGYVYVMARTDDIINVAGHRLSTGAMEEVLADHPDVAEAAVLGVGDQLKGQIPVGFLVLNAGVKGDQDKIIKEVVQMVRDRIGPVAAFKKAVVVKRLPKTRSGKILRGTIQKMADCEAYKVPATIDDPMTLPEIETALKQMGYAQPGSILREAS
jgi:propionyl-CoA synthetase